MFKKQFDASRLSSSLRISVNRLKMLQKKKNEMSCRARKEIADYVADSKVERARIKTEHIIREDYFVEALDIIEGYCELLLNRIGLLENTGNDMVPLDIETAVATMLYAAPRIYQDVPEMQKITKEFSKKYKKQVFEELARDVSKVNPKIVYKLDTRPPKPLLIEKYLETVCLSHNVPYVPDISITTETLPNLSADDFGGNDNGAEGGIPDEVRANPQINSHLFDSSNPTLPYPILPNQANSTPYPLDISTPYPPSATSFPEKPTGGPSVNLPRQPNELINRPPTYFEATSIDDHSDDSIPPSKSEEVPPAPQNAPVGNEAAWAALELPSIPTNLPKSGGSGGSPGGNTAGGSGGGNPSNSIDLDDLQSRFDRLKKL